MSKEETIDTSNILANKADEDLKEALALNHIVVMTNGDAQIENNSDTFLNVTNVNVTAVEMAHGVAATSESNVGDMNDGLIDSLTNLLDDTGRTLFYEMEEFWNFQFEDNLNFQLL